MDPMLAAREVVVERYTWAKQDSLGVWLAPSGARVASLNDPDDNVLSLTRRARLRSGAARIENIFMYIPRSYSEERPEELTAFIGAHPLGALVTSDSSGALFATHLPFVFDVAAGDHGVLTGHLARANPHHKLPPGDVEALVIFSGPEAYITPNWYPGRWTHGREVPTWNYVAVHAYGALRFIDDPEWLLPHLRRLTERSEATGTASPNVAPWRVDDAPAEYIGQMMKAIVGVEIRVTRLEGKWKMSQNRTPETIAGVIAGLTASPKPMDREVAEIVAERSTHARES